MNQYRTQVLAKVSKAIRIQGDKTPGKQDATIQALAVVLATAGLSARRQPYTQERVEWLANKLLACIDQGIDDFVDSN